MSELLNKRFSCKECRNKELALKKVKEKFELQYVIHDVHKRTPKTKRVTRSSAIWNCSHVLLGVIEDFNLYLTEIQNQQDQEINQEEARL